MCVQKQQLENELLYLLTGELVVSHKVPQRDKCFFFWDRDKWPDSKLLCVPSLPHAAAFHGDSFFRCADNVTGC